MNLQVISRSNYLLFSLTVTLLFFGWHGYFFNSGDQEEHLPQVYKMFDPVLYPHDYFMKSVDSTFSIRFYYKWTVYIFSQVMPVAWTCFFLNFVCIFLTSYCISRITAFFSNDLFSAFLAPFLLLVMFPDYALGDNSFQDNALICSTISVMLCTAALLQYFRRNYLFMALLTGIAAWFQVIESILMIVIFAGLSIFDSRLSVKQIAGILLVWMLASAPMLIPMINIHLVKDSSRNSDLYYEALYWIRNPNHYLPSFFDVTQYIKFALLMVAAFAGMRFVDNHTKKFVMVLTALVVFGMLAYYLLLENASLMIIGKTQWFKASIWLTAVYSIVVAVACSKLINHFLKSGLIKKYLTTACIVIIIILPVLIFNSGYIPIKRFQNISLGNYIKSDQTLMHEWIRANTPVDAVFLISPDNFSFLCEAQRSLLIGYKAVIHEPYFMIPWAENFQRIYHFDHDTLTRQSTLAAAIKGFNNVWYQPLKNEKVDYRLDNLQTSKIDLADKKIVHKQGDLVLTKF